MKKYIVVTRSATVEINADDIDEINGYLYLYSEKGEQVAIFAEREWVQVTLNDK